MKVNHLFMLFALSLSLLNFQPTDARPPVPDLDLFLQPLHMTTAGVQSFFENLYNSKRYTEDFYPNNFTHLEQFLEHGAQTQQEKSYTKAIFSLFSQKTKGCLYISAYAFDDLLAQLPRLVGYHFEQSAKTAEQKKQEIKQILWQEFLNNFEVCKTNPHQFFDNISDSVLNAVDPDAHEEISSEYLRQNIIRFIESSLGKILWDPTDKNIWNNVKSIGDHLVELTKHNIITNLDDLNDIAWSLVHRLCYFVEITGSELPLAFYEEVNLDLQNPTQELRLLEEQEELAESKKSMLEHVIFEGIARQHAREYGLITEALPA